MIQHFISAILLDSDLYGISYFPFRKRAIINALDMSLLINGDSTNMKALPLKELCECFHTIIIDDSCSIQSLHMTLFYLLKLKFISESGVILMHVWHALVLKSDNILSFFLIFLGNFVAHHVTTMKNHIMILLIFFNDLKPMFLPATIYGLYELYLLGLQFCSKFASRTFHLDNSYMFHNYYEVCIIKCRLSRIFDSSSVWRSSTPSCAPYTYDCETCFYFI